MSGLTIEWIAFLAFLILFGAAVATEILWLVRAGWASVARSIAYVLITDLVSFTIGSVFVFVTFFIIFMMVMGPSGTGSDMPQIAYRIVLALAIIVPPIVSVFVKRIFLLFLSIKSGRSAWIYSVGSSLLLLVVTLLPPPLIYYLLGNTGIWT